MKSYILFLSFLCCQTIAISQSVLTSQIFDQKFTTIPSFAGQNDYTSLTFSSQKKWMGINNSPFTAIFGMNWKIGNFDFYNPSGLVNKTGLKTKDRNGIGLEISTDKTGYMYTNGINIAYAYHYPIGESKLSFGLGIHLNQNYFQNDQLNPYEKNDPLVPSNNEVNYYFNSTIGVSYYNLYNYYLGISAANFLNPLQKIEKNIQRTPEQDKNYTLLLGKYFHLDNYKFLEPVFELSTSFSHNFFTIMGLRYIYKKGCWVSLFENNNFHEVHGNLAVLYRKTSYCIGYCYDTGSISKYQYGSVEFSILLRIGDLSRIEIY